MFIMKISTRLVLALMLLLAFPLKHWGQEPYRQYAEDGILLNFHEIDNIGFRAFLLYNLYENDQFILTADEEPGLFSISSNDEGDIVNLHDAFETLYQKSLTDFSLLSKMDIVDQMTHWKSCIPPTYFVSIMTDVIVRSNRPNNNHCIDSDPFCTSDQITFDAAATSQTADELEGTTLQDGCIGSSYNPSWYHMRIQTGGQFIIHMEGHDPNSGTNRDIDFCMWGPFTDPTSPCVAQLTTDKIIDCSFSAHYSEDIFLGYPDGEHYHGSSGTTSHGTVNYHLPVQGEYYILMITNFSQQPCTITFTKTEGSGPGTTDCGILPGIVNNDGPYCVGETIHLTVNQQAGATYTWTGPNGYSASGANPSRPNCTMAMAGTYTCVTHVGNETASATTEVVIYPQPTANFTNTSVCVGNATQFTSTSTTNPPGQNITRYQWNFGDGTTGAGQTVSHNYSAAGSYPVTLTVQTSGNCNDSFTRNVEVYAMPTPSATAQPSTVIYGASTTLTANAGTQGVFNFHWEPANLVANPNAQTTQTVGLQETTTFTVTVTNPQGGCSSTAQVIVSIDGSGLLAMATADQTDLCDGESTTLHAIPSGGAIENYTFSWSPAGSLNNPNSQNPVASPALGNTTYTCHVSDGFTDINVSVTLHVHPNVEHDIYQTICEDDTYSYFGEDIHTPGVYDHTLHTQYGCDSIIHLHLDNWQTYETPVTDRFCQGDQYDFFGEAIGTPGVYHHTLQSIHGCDSVVRLNLQQDPSYEFDIWESTCQGGPGYYFEGQYYQPSADVYDFHYTTQQHCDSVIYLHVEESQYNSKYYNISLCGTQYTWPSNGVTYYETGVYYDTLQYAGTCDSTLILNLEIRPNYNDEVVATSCDEYRWRNDDYGVDMTFTESTVYTHHYTNAFGCSSEATLFLTINDHDEYDFTVPEEEACDEYFWDPQGHEIVYTDHNELSYNMSGTYHRTYKNQADCDSLVTMRVQLEYTPHPTPIYPMDADNTAPHWVVTASEFQINTYDFNLWDTNPNCRWDTVTWTFEGAPDWFIEPFGQKGMCCKVYVLGQVNDTVWLTAHAFNRCAPEDGITQRYWMVCSFYGTEELSAADFSVVPNPNKGQMTLNFDKLTGKINVKVYDMKGTLLDKFETYNNAGPSTYTYQMKHHADGIYFFVATGKEGTLAKKVIIQR